MLRITLSKILDEIQQPVEAGKISLELICPNKLFYPVSYVIPKIAQTCWIVTVKENSNAWNLVTALMPLEKIRRTLKYLTKANYN